MRQFIFILSFILIVGSISIQTAYADENSSTVLTFSLALHGIGSAGDKKNMKDASMSNKNPLTLKRSVQVDMDTSAGAPVLTTTLPVTYDNDSGTYTGKLLFGHDVASGMYKVMIKTAGYLKADVTGKVSITQHEETKLPLTDLTAGDVNEDNKLDILDYNLLLECGYGSIEPLSQSDPKSVYNTQKCQNHDKAKNTDLNDDGVINSTDYNLFLREL